jgi:hypothetical protein
MTTQLTDLFTALFDALEALDQQLDGYGLYAIREHQSAKKLPLCSRPWIGATMAPPTKAATGQIVMDGQCGCA